MTQRLDSRGSYHHSRRATYALTLLDRWGDLQTSDIVNAAVLTNYDIERVRRNEGEFRLAPPRGTSLPPLFPPEVLANVQPRYATYNHPRSATAALGWLNDWYAATKTYAVNESIVSFCRVIRALRYGGVASLREASARSFTQLWIPGFALIWNQEDA